MTTSPQEHKRATPDDAESLHPPVAPPVPPPPPPWLIVVAERLPAYALVLFFSLLQAFYNLGNGFWEGGETTRARMALAMKSGELHWFAPLLDGALQPISWMEMLLLRVGGPSEFLLRLPFLGLSTLSLLILANIMVQHSGRWTAAFAVALAGATPLLIFGGASLHGYAGVVAPIGTTTLMLAHYSAKEEEYPILRGAGLGLAFGMSYLAWGVVGAAIPVLTGLLLSWTRGMVAPTLRSISSSSFVAMLIVAVPTFPLIASVGLETALPYILWPQLVADAAPQSFDVLIRRIGFSTFPLAAFLPFSVAWLSSRMKDEEHDFHSRSTLFTLGLLVAAAATFAIVGVAHAVRPAPVAPMALSFAALAAISVSGSWRKNLRRSASYLTLMTSTLLLLLMARDLRGHFSAEEGRPGPYVLLEPLLNSSENFSESYRVSGLFYLSLAIIALLLIGYTDVPSRLRDLQRLLKQANAQHAVEGRLYRTLEWFRRRSHQVLLRFSVGRIAIGIALLMVLQAVLITQRYLPDYSVRVSDRALIEHLQTMRQPSDALYAVKALTAPERFYLQGVDARPLEDLVALERQFCDRSERVFALLTPTQSQEFYSVMRRASQRLATCASGGDFYILNDQSAHLLLVSNELHEERGEQSASSLQRSVLASSDDLPTDLIVPEQPFVVSGALEYLGATITPARLRVRGDVTIRSYWRVRRSPTVNWEMLTHLDNRGHRINADHIPLDDKLQLNRLFAGDVFVDTHTVPLKILSERSGTYNVFLGFFHGETRMEVEPSIPFHRIPAGSFELRGFF